MRRTYEFRVQDLATEGAAIPHELYLALDRKAALHLLAVVAGALEAFGAARYADEPMRVSVFGTLERVAE